MLCLFVQRMCDLVQSVRVCSLHDRMLVFMLLTGNCPGMHARMSHAVSQHCSQRWYALDADGPMTLFGEDASYSRISEEIGKVDGVITHGMFVNVANSAAVFTEEGVQWFESAALV